MIQSGSLETMWNRLFLALDKDRSHSLQGQIRRTLVSAILEGQLPVGVPIPSSRRLADELGVSRNTVVLAYQQLVEEGFLLSRERSGYFVSDGVVGSGTFGTADRGKALRGPAFHWKQRLGFAPSKQRNIVKPANWLDYPFPFVYGQFDPHLFPTLDWRECCLKQLSVMEVRDWAPDLVARDDPSLIKEVQAKVLPRRGVWARPEEILITVGAQQALYLLADLLFTPRSVVGVEDPGYPDARNIFTLRTSRLQRLALDSEGISLGREIVDCDYVYVTPSHQCPSTITMSLRRREDLLELAEKRDFVVIEDDFESETGFGSVPTPALKSLDVNDRVLYVGSLSKAFAPGLRVGFVVGPEVVIRELRALRRLMVRHPSAFIQRSFAMFLALGHYDSLQRRLYGAYRERVQILQAALTEHLVEARFVPVSGGASCWVTGPDELDARELLVAAAARGVLIEPGDVFFAAEDPPLNCFRLGITSIPTHKIEAGIVQLGAAMRELC